MVATVLQICGLAGLVVAGALASIPLLVGAIGVTLIFVGLALEDR